MITFLKFNARMKLELYCPTHVGIKLTNKSNESEILFLFFCPSVVYWLIYLFLQDKNEFRKCRLILFMKFTWLINFGNNSSTMNIVLTFKLIECNVIIMFALLLLLKFRPLDVQFNSGETQAHHCSECIIGTYTGSNTPRSW